MDLHVRLDCLEGYEALRAELIALSELWVYSEEGSKKNPHTHIVLLDCSKNANLVRKLIRKYPTFVGNKSYSVSERRKDRVELIAYVMKDGVVQHQLPSELLEEVEIYLKDYKDGKKESKTVWRNILAKYEALGDFPSSDKDRLLMQCIVDYHVENDLMVRRNMVMCYFDTIRAYKWGDTLWMELYTDWFERKRKN